MTNLDKAREMQARTKAFALRIIRLSAVLPETDVARILGRQVLRSGTSVAANYRAVCRAKSKADVVSKMGTVVEETDETVLWLELLVEGGVVSAVRMQELLDEANELLCIFGSALRTAKRRPVS